MIGIHRIIKQHLRASVVRLKEVHLVADLFRVLYAAVFKMCVEQMQHT